MSTVPGRPVRCAGIEVHDVEDGAVIYHPGTDDVHFLNDTARCVMLLCDGQHDAAEMDEALARLCNARAVPGLTAPILEQFAAAGLIEDASARTP
jgi:hypothetical protein